MEKNIVEQEIQICHDNLSVLVEQQQEIQKRLVLLRVITNEFCYFNVSFEDDYYGLLNGNIWAKSAEDAERIEVKGDVENVIVKKLEDCPTIDPVTRNIVRHKL